MSAPPKVPGSSQPPSGKRERSSSGWATHKARDARRQAEYFESKQSLESRSYTLGMLDDHQLQIHLAPPLQEKYAATALFERFKGGLVRRPRPKWPAAVVVRMERDKPTRHYCTSGGCNLAAQGPRTSS